MKFTKQTLKRALRTFFQSFISIVAVGITAIDFTEISAVKTGLIGLCASAVAGGISAIMNLEGE